MNTLNLIRQRVLKQQALSQAQFLMAKAYRGVSYTDAHHGEVSDSWHSSERKARLYRGRPY